MQYRESKDGVLCTQYMVCRMHVRNIEEVAHYSVVDLTLGTIC